MVVMFFFFCFSRLACRGNSGPDLVLPVGLVKSDLSMRTSTPMPTLMPALATAAVILAMIALGGCL